MTEREGFEASNARALNGFLVLGSSFRSVSTRHSCTFYWGSLATKYPLMVPDTFWGYPVGLHSSLQIGRARLGPLHG